MGNGKSNIERWMASKTPEEAAELRRKGNVNSVAALKKRSEERQIIANVTQTLVTASQDYLAEHSKELIDRLGNIALTSKNEKNIMSALSLIADISGQKAAIQVKVGLDTAKPFEQLDLKVMSDDELLQMSMRYHDDDVVDGELVEVEDE